MMTNFIKVQAGRKFKPSAGTWNAMIDAARAHLERRFAQPTASSPVEGGQPTVLRVRNDAQQDLERFAIVGLDELLIKPDENFAAFVAQPAISAVVPQVEQHHQRFAVIQQPLRHGQIGKAVAHGATACKVDVKHTADEFCCLIDDDATKLVSGAGNCRILSKLTADGEQWGYVQLGGQAPQRWWPWKNANGRTMPAYGIVLLYEPFNPTTETVFRSHTSNDAYRVAFGVNYPVEVEDGGYGLLTMDFPAWCAHVSYDPPDFDDIFGHKVDADKLYRYGQNGTDMRDISESVFGFSMLGPRRTNPDRALMQWDPQRLIIRPIIRFTLTENLTTTSPSATIDVEETYGNVGPAACERVYNVLDDSNAPGNFIFSGSIGDTGLAFAHPQAKRYYILWIECAHSCG
ncbi:MAG: hypothetical protein RIC55_02530 [Pirellulaceae bacterium]